MSPILQVWMVEDLRWVSRLEVVCFCWFSYLFLHVKKPLAHDYHRARRWISFNPSCQSYEKPWHRQGPTQCWMPWGAAKWWATDGRMEWFCGEISNRKGLFFCFFGGLDGNSTKKTWEKPIRVAWISLRWFCVVWVNHLGSSKAASSVGCLFGTGMKLFNSIQSQKSSSGWHGEYTPEN